MTETPHRPAPTTGDAARMPALYIGHGAPPLLDDAAVERASSPPGRATCRARRRS